MPGSALKHASSQCHSRIDLEDQNIPFLFRQNKRIRRTRLVMSAEEGLVYESPKSPKIENAKRLIRKRKDWVLENWVEVLEKQAKVFEVKKQKRSVLIFGKEKTIEIRRSQKRDFILENKNNIILGYAKSKVTYRDARTTLTNWLKRKGTDYLPLRLRQLNKKNFKINKVYVKDQRTQWGSCSETGNIHLNWRIIMAPKFAVDYIIYHEMCHTKHMDHSKRFWNLVEEVCPNYKKAEKWFKDYGFILYQELL